MHYDTNKNILMIKNILISYLRNLSRNKAISFINIFGLSLGLASCFIIMLFVIGELRMDSFQKNRKNIYRVNLFEGEKKSTSSNVSYLFGPAAKQEFPEIEDYARLIDLGKIKIKQSTGFIEEGGFLFADHSVFNILTFDIIEGEASKALTGTNNIAIAQTIASKYFGSASAVGKNLILSIKGEDQIVTIAAVYAHLPSNSSIKLNLLGNIELGKKNLLKMLITYGNDSKPKEWQDAWDHNFYSTLVKLAPGTDAIELAESVNKSFKEHMNQKDNSAYTLQRYDKIYLNSNHIPYDNWAHGKLSNIYIFSATALLILIIACFNYLILSLAQSEKRAKEIGIRKASGADFGKLLQQVMFESVTIAIIALPVAIGFTELILPILNSLLDKNLVVDYTQNVIFIAGVVSITLLVGIVSGLYIAFYLNRFNPIVILRGNNVQSGVHSTFLKSLVIAQVTIFIALIICSLTIVKQLRFVVNYNPGINTENVITIRLNDFGAQTNYPTFRQELEKLSEVQSVTAALLIPPSNSRMTMGVPRVDDPTKTAFLEAILADYGFIETLGLTITEGRSFSKESPTADGIIINQAAVNELGLKETLGTKLPFGTVIGVVKDFHIHDLRSKITPAYVVLNNQTFFEIAIKTKSDYHSALPKMKQLWEKINSDVSFESSTLQEKVENQYQAESRLSVIILSFTIVAIVIAAMGLFGLSNFISQLRTKEIGIRKVNGGTLFQMVFLMWKEIIIWTIIAFIIASPVAWFAMQKWLENFAYKTGLSWWIFVLAGLMALSIALLAVSWQAYRTARRNPVEALRYE
jgi:putative ABC transport system permease protein